MILYAVILVQPLFCGFKLAHSMISQSGTARKAQHPASPSSTAQLTNAKARSHGLSCRRGTRALCLLGDKLDPSTVAVAQATVISCGVPISRYTRSEALSAVSGKAFGCTMCGKCCTLAGDAEVWLNHKELEGVAAFLGVGIDSAVQLYMQPYEQVPSWYLLQSKSISGPWPFDAQNSQQEQQPGTAKPQQQQPQQQQQRQVCVFLDAATNACSIYPVRPLQCSTYPWWPEIMAGHNWAVEQQHWCEGIQHPDAPPLDRWHAAQQLQLATEHTLALEAAKPYGWDADEQLYGVTCDSSSSSSSISNGGKRGPDC